MNYQESMKEAERKMIEALVEFARQAGNTEHGRAEGVDPM